jgi:hypothetical protein
MASVKEWIEEKKECGYIRYFEYNEFSDIVKIGRGSFGLVSKAVLANTGPVALKSIIREDSEKLNEVNKEFVKEVEIALFMLCSIPAWYIHINKINFGILIFFFS